MVFLCCATGADVKTFELSSDEMRLHRAMSSLNAEVTCARYSHNGKIIASCSVDGGICLNVASSGELLSRFFYPAKSVADRRVNTVHFSSGSRFLSSGGSDGCVNVWDLKTQEISQTYGISASAVTSVTFSGYKDDFIVAGNKSGAISVCDLQSAETVGFLSVDPKFGVSSVTSVVASPHPYARQIVGSTYGDGSVRVWDLHSGQLVAEFANHHDDAATCLVLSPVSKVLLATGGLDRRVLFFDTLQRRELRSMDLDAPVSSLALCADGKTLAVGTTTGDVFVYDLRGAITPLYATIVGDSGGDGASGIKSLQFAAASSDNADAIVFSTGQPVVSTERVNGALPSPTKAELGGGAYGRTASPQAPTLPSCDSGRHPEIPVLFSPPSNSNASRQGGLTNPTTHLSPVESSPDEPLSKLELLQQHQTPSLLNELHNSSPTRLGESPPCGRQPSLLSMLAEASPQRNNSVQDTQVVIPAAAASLPLTSPTSYSTHASPTFGRSRQSLAQEMEQLQATINGHHDRQQQDLAKLLQTVLAKYDALVEENCLLRRDNESLRAHLAQHTSGATSV